MRIFVRGRVGGPECLAVALVQLSLGKHRSRRTRQRPARLPQVGRFPQSSERSRVVLPSSTRPARPPLLRLTLVRVARDGGRVRLFVWHATVRPVAGRVATTQRTSEGQEAERTPSQREDRRRAQGDPRPTERMSGESKIRSPMPRREQLRAKVAESTSQRCRSRRKRARPHQVSVDDEGGTAVSRRVPDPRVVKYPQPLGGAEKVGDLARWPRDQRVFGAGAELDKFREVKLAPSPVVPPREAWAGRTWQSLLAEPPFVQPPADDPRISAAMLHDAPLLELLDDDAGGDLISYTTFAGGFALLVYVGFYVLARHARHPHRHLPHGRHQRVAAYVLHGIIGGAVKNFIPQDSSAWYVITA